MEGFPRHRIRDPEASVARRHLLQHPRPVIFLQCPLQLRVLPDIRRQLQEAAVVPLLPVGRGSEQVAIHVVRLERDAILGSFCCIVEHPVPKELQRFRVR